MTFHSILFEEPEVGQQKEVRRAPDCFPDLNLDQIVGAVTAGKRDYDLKPFFYAPLDDVSAIEYRHQVMRDLESDKKLLEGIKSFAEKMVVLRRYLRLMEKLTFLKHRQGWFLAAVEVYCDAVAGLAHDLHEAAVESRGFLTFREYIFDYVASDAFSTLRESSENLQAALSTIHYCVLIKGRTVRVRKYAGEADYSEEVHKTFEKFKQRDPVKDYHSSLGRRSGMSHVEAEILDCVARLYPEIFADLAKFCSQHSEFMNQTIVRFDHEIQFYIAYLDHIKPLTQNGLRFCYPQMVTRTKQVHNNDGFDLALAHKLLQEESPVIKNDFYLSGPERIIVVSGPNQGGKTTFGRMFGQLHYLARLGIPVPGREAQLFLYDEIFTHFEREERIQDLRGKLQDDLIRIQKILEHATPESIIVINEIFSSTTVSDAASLSEKIMNRILQLDSLCVWVTFIDELASLSEKTVSMVSTVVPDNPALRTFKIVRRPADGLAYALSIAEKHGLTFQKLVDRIPS